MPPHTADTTPVLLQNGFRPFFMAAGLWATLAVPMWLLSYAGVAELPAGLDGFLWHQHEMLYGFAGAAMAGFLLTAIPNWTGRAPVRGRLLGVLVGFWLAGRLGFISAVAIGPLATAVLDLAFLTTLATIIGRELVAGGNWRNLPVLALISAFTLGNWLVHLELNAVAATADIGLRLSTFVLAILIALIGGRIVPAFTRNWLAQQGATDLPPAMAKFDTVALLALVAFVIAQVIAPDHQIAGGLALLAGGLHALRLSRWKGLSVLGEPLLWVMHLGYAWLCAALILVGASNLSDAVPMVAAVHALTAGAFGTMILAVMTRASLGHAGRELRATRATTTVFILITIAALLRVFAPMLDDLATPAFWLAGAAWTGAFGLFSVLFFPVFTQPKT